MFKKTVFSWKKKNKIWLRLFFFLSSSFLASKIKRITWFLIILSAFTYSAYKGLILLTLTKQKPLEYIFANIEEDRRFKQKNKKKFLSAPFLFKKKILSDTFSYSHHRKNRFSSAVGVKPWDFRLCSICSPVSWTRTI